MPTFEAYSLTGDGTLFTLQDGDTIRIGANVILLSYGAAENSTAAVQALSGAAVLVSGAVTSYDCAVELGDSPDDWGSYVFVNRTGTLTSVAGSRGALHVMSQAFDIVNEGTVTGMVGMRLSTHDTPSSLENTGTITATGEAILRTDFDGAGNSELRAGLLEVKNTGTISGGLAAYDARSAGALGLDAIYNAGQMVGDVFLGAGDDSYTALRGGRVKGWIFGNAGNDLFRPGTAREKMDGGEGVDTLDFRNTAGVRVALANPSANLGLARGDNYTAFEVIFGSRRGADWLRGSEEDEQLFGFGGRDRLIGGAGDDQLSGGASRDRLTGGDGADQFIFRRPKDAGDIITDFDADGSGLDRIVIDLAGFRSGLGFGFGDQSIDRDDVRILYDAAHKRLSVDFDGIGGQKPIFIARVLTGGPITEDDIIFLGSTPIDL